MVVFLKELSKSFKNTLLCSQLQISCRYLGTLLNYKEKRPLLQKGEVPTYIGVFIHSGVVCIWQTITNDIIRCKQHLKAFKNKNHAKWNFTKHLLKTNNNYNLAFTNKLHTLQIFAHALKLSFSNQLPFKDIPRCRTRY